MIEIKPLLSNELSPVYLVQMHLFESELSRFSKILSPSEKVKVDSFHFEADRKNYKIRHGIFRTILSRYNNIPPNQLNIQKNENGKPFLSNAASGQEFEFSLSSSDDYFVFCFGKNIRLGIDIELIREDDDFKGMAKSFFSHQENAFLENLPKHEFIKAFLRIWTAKEAFVKANRIIEPDKFNVFFSSFPGNINPVFFDNLTWYFHSVEIFEKIMLTLVTDQTDRQVECVELKFDDIFG